MPFERVHIKNESELEEIVARDISVIEEGLTVIDRILTDSGKIILCCDKDSHLVILDPSLHQNDNALFHGIRYLDHYSSVISLINNDKEKIKLDVEPRLILIAPTFSDDLLRVIKYIDTVKIDIYQWEYLKLENQKGLYLKSISPMMSDDKKTKVFYHLNLDERRLWAKLRDKLLEYRNKDTSVIDKDE
jgi:hypothetical protein